MYNYLQKQQLNTQVSNLLRTHIIRSYFQEFEEMIQTDDEQLQEAYAYLSKSRKKTIYDALKLCISDIDRYIGNVKSAKPKSPKKKRPVSTENQIKSLKKRLSESDSLFSFPSQFSQGLTRFILT
jgi:hypothetical protein